MSNQNVAGQEVTWKQRIACVDRELKMRRQVYPRWTSGDKPKITQAAADEEIRRMESVRSAVLRCEALERVVKKLGIRANIPPGEYYELIHGVQDELALELAHDADAREGWGRRGNGKGR